MFWRPCFTLSLAVGAFFPTTVAARDYDLAPSSKWVMDYADDSCRLMRSFGTGDDQVVAQFIRYAPGARFDFHLIGKPLGHQSNHPVARVRFGIDGEFIRGEAMAGSAGKLPALFLAGRLDNFDTGKLGHSDFAKMDAAQLAALDSIAPELEAAVTSATIRLSDRTVTLHLNTMGAPMAALRKCTTDLVKLWGLDPAEQEALSIKPQPANNPAGWLRIADYPAGSLIRGEQAIIRYRLMIDSTGRPTACSIQSAIAKGNFADVSCALLKRRARFQPALAADGTARPSYSVGKVKWIIP